MAPGNFYEAFIQKSPLFNSATCVRDTRYLEPVFRVKIEELLDRATNLGRPLVIVETYRSKARQTALYKAKATSLPYVGCHHFGLAADFAKLVNGDPTWKGDWSFMGKLANSLGLVWGGPGHGNLDIGDFDHVQRCAFSDQSYLFTNQWYPEPDYAAWVPT